MLEQINSNCLEDTKEWKGISVHWGLVFVIMLEHSSVSHRKGYINSLSFELCAVGLIELTVYESDISLMVCALLLGKAMLYQIVLPLL